MEVFSFDPAQYADEYERQGWIHVRNGVTPEFLSYLTGYVEREFGQKEVEGRAIGGSKKQAIFEFPSEVEFPGELFDVVATLAGLERATMTLSERHIKAYDADADANPPAHKDRFASKVSMGISIDIPANSKLVLYPEADVGVNPFNVSETFRKSLDPDRRPEAILASAREVVIDDGPGDVMAFPGSAVWHLRRNSANAVNLYLKFNDFNSDPLGEDPTTARRREATLAALSADGDLDGHVPVNGRRMDGVARRYGPGTWAETAYAEVWGDDPVLLDERQLSLLRSIDGERSLEELTRELARDGTDSSAVRMDVRRLAERGVLDLLAPTETA